MKSYISAGAALCLFLLTAASFAASSAVPADLAGTGAGYGSGAGARAPVFPTTLRTLPLKTTRTLRRRAKIRKKRKRIKTIKK